MQLIILGLDNCMKKKKKGNLKETLCNLCKVFGVKYCIACLRPNLSNRAIAKQWDV